MTKPSAGKHPIRNRTAFRNRIARWFAHNGEDYPWRRTRDPYAVLVSEIMLQQTQVATVLGRGYFTNWMRRFPDLQSLARAEEDEVLKAWEGLGYYRRARNLHKAARHLVAECDCRFPVSLQEIESLPGVGRYTAGAVASFAFDLPAAIVDANIARVFARLFDFQQDISSTDGRNQLWEWAELLVPETSARLFNSGLMELGQKNCGAQAVSCADCPVAAFCQCKDPLALPKKKPPMETVLLDEHAIWSIRGNRILLEKEGGSRRKGLWKLPNRILDEVGDLPVVLSAKYGITNHRVSLFVHEAHPGTTPVKRAAESWIPIDALSTIAMQSPHRRALNRLLTAGSGPERGL